MKTESSFLLNTSNTSQPQRQTLSQIKGLGKIFQSNGPKKQMAILISNQIDFKLKSVKRDKRHFIIVTGKIHQE